MEGELLVAVLFYLTYDVFGCYSRWETEGWNGPGGCATERFWGGEERGVFTPQRLEDRREDRGGIGFGLRIGDCLARRWAAVPQGDGSERWEVDSALLSGMVVGVDEVLAAG